MSPCFLIALPPCRVRCLRVKGITRYFKPPVAVSSAAAGGAPFCGAAEQLLPGNLSARPDPAPCVQIQRRGRNLTRSRSRGASDSEDGRMLGAQQECRALEGRLWALAKWTGSRRRISQLQRPSQRRLARSL